MRPLFETILTKVKHRIW